MKTVLPISLFALMLMTGPVFSAEKNDLGTVMFVGDSITHGVNCASYRWALHKILVDNGINYESVGVMTGNNSGGVMPDTQYGGVAFNNRHSSQASARAYEIAGRRNAGRYGRFGFSNIGNWLGQGTVMNNDKPYAGEVFKGDKAPDVFTLLIGTNDLLSDGNNATIHTRLADVGKKLTGDLDTIIAAMKKANPKAKIYVLTVPCWTRHGNANSDETHGAVEDWNKTLNKWAKSKKGVKLVEVNDGMLDVASEKVFYGLESMFNVPGRDGLHPNAQGDLLMAGHVARAMGIAGRTAGQKRKAAADLVIQVEKPSAAYSYAWQGNAPDKGFTCDVQMQMGDGKKGGWNTSDNLTITVGDGAMTVNEAYIKWGDTVLYSTDMSANTANLRVAYVPGNSAEGLKGGYYVWLGDMLIGEALPANGGENKGVTLKKNGSIPVNVKSVAVDVTGAYAPISKGARSKNAYLSKGGTPAVKAPKPQKFIKWNESTVYNKQGGVAYLYAKPCDGNGNAWLVVKNAKPITGWTGAHGGKEVLNGDAHLAFMENAVGGGSVFGAVNSGKVMGSVAIELSAPKAVFKSFTSGKNPAAVVGAFKGDINGNVLIGMNCGTLESSLMGGIHTGNNTIGGNVEVIINGGSIKGDVMAGGCSGIIKGNTRVTICGSYPRISGNISAGGMGTVEGFSTVRLENISESATPDGFDQYAGMISGGKKVKGSKTLALSNVKVPEFKAKFSDFTRLFVDDGTFTKISSAGGAKELIICKASGIEVLSPSDATAVKLGENAAFAIKGLSAPKVVVDITEADKFNFTLTKIPSDVKNIVFKKGDKEYPARMTTDTQADTARITPEM